MDGFQRRKEKKKEDILEAATALFMEEGIQKVAISEIAKKANVSQVTIYNYFESKHNLIHEVVIFYIDNALKEFKAIIHDTIPFPEKVKHIIFHKKERAIKIHEEFYQYLMKEYATEGHYFEKIYMEKAIPYFAEFFNQGKEQGFINRNLSNEAILLYIQMIAEYFRKEEIYQHALPLTDDLTNIFFYGIVGKGDK